MRSDTERGMGVPLTLRKKETEEFRHIAGDKNVTVKWSSSEGFFYLFQKGRFIMYLAHPINSNERKRVRDHFAKVRSGWYRKNIRKQTEDRLKREKENEEYMVEQHRLESVEIGQDIIIKEKISVTV